MAATTDRSASRGAAGTKKRRKRVRPARSAKVLTTGLAASAVLALTALMGAQARATAPEPVALTTTTRPTAVSASGTTGAATTGAAPTATTIPARRDDDHDDSGHGRGRGDDNSGPGNAERRSAAKTPRTAAADAPRKTKERQPTVPATSTAPRATKAPTTADPAPAPVTAEPAPDGVVPTSDGRTGGSR